VRRKKNPVRRSLVKQKNGDADDDEGENTGGEIGSVGSVAAGGRYDSLVGMFGNYAVPCVGLSIGVERLFAIQETLHQRALAQNTTNGEDGRPPLMLRSTDTEVMVITAQKSLVDQRLKIVSQLRAAGIKTASADKDNPRYLDQMKYCENNGIPFALVIGEEELKNGVAKVRHITSKEEASLPLDELSVNLKEFMNKFQ
jgi:histidyl-tRNA synthetase